MKKLSLCVISGMVLILLMTVQTFGAELSGEVEANYRAMMRASHGTYPGKQGIILVTKDKMGGVVPLGHAAITTSKTHVMEAHTFQGVHYGLNDWNRTKDTCYGFKDKYNIDLNGGQYGKAIYPPEMIDSGYVYRIYIQ